MVRIIHNTFWVRFVAHVNRTIVARRGWNSYVSLSDPQKCGVPWRSLVILIASILCCCIIVLFWVLKFTIVLYIFLVYMLHCLMLSYAVDLFVFFPLLFYLNVIFLLNLLVFHMIVELLKICTFETGLGPHLWNSGLVPGNFGNCGPWATPLSIFWHQQISTK